MGKNQFHDSVVHSEMHYCAHRSTWEHFFALIYFPERQSKYFVVEKSTYRDAYMDSLKQAFILQYIFDQAEFTRILKF